MSIIHLQQSLKLLCTQCDTLITSTPDQTVSIIWTSLQVTLSGSEVRATPQITPITSHQGATPCCTTTVHRLEAEILCTRLCPSMEARWPRGRDGRALQRITTLTCFFCKEIVHASHLSEAATKLPQLDQILTSTQVEQLEVKEATTIGIELPKQLWVAP